MVRFVTTRKHQVSGPASANEVSSVPRPNKDPHFTDTIPHWLTITEVACFGSIQTSQKSCFTLGIPHTIKPIIKLRCSVYGVFDEIRHGFDCSLLATTCR
ncbi:hypothetical protein PCPL58_p5071 (plasmid) [Pseudomonas cerasi]|nr:hypothetical protein PCPL58_p5071 [Pseudomonas cerasi]